MDSDVSAAIVLELIHSEWRELEAPRATAQTYIYLLGYVSGALDALLARRGVPDTDSADVRRAALEIISSRRPDLHVNLQSIPNNSDFKDGQLFGHRAVRIFLDSGDSNELDYGREKSA